LTDDLAAGFRTPAAYSKDEIWKMRKLLWLSLGATLTAGTGLASDGVTFRHALDDSPLEFKYRTDQKITEAVETFHETGENPYAGDADAIADGEAVYRKFCQSCHLKDGSGRIGPNLTDDQWKRERTGTDVGRFEIIYGGGAGAMQPFGRRMDQDDILKVMAYVDTLRDK
jgi:cytochrome c-L